MGRPAGRDQPSGEFLFQPGFDDAESADIGRAKLFPLVFRYSDFALRCRMVWGSGCIHQFAFIADFGDARRLGFVAVKPL